MKAITLIAAENYPMLTAYVATDSTGTQRISFVSECHDGSKLVEKTERVEGEHLPLDGVALFQVWAAL